MNKHIRIQETKATDPTDPDPKNWVGGESWERGGF